MTNQITQLIQLNSLSSYSEHTLLLMRLLIGSFLIWGVSDNILSEQHMQVFIDFMKRFGFVYPEVLAVLSVWAQFFIGLCFVLGLFTRWAGILCVINFIVAIVMVDSQSGIRASFPSAFLIAFGLYMMTRGAGRFSLDQKLFAGESAK